MSPQMGHFKNRKLNLDDIPMIEEISNDETNNISIITPSKNARLVITRGKKRSVTDDITGWIMNCSQVNIRTKYDEENREYNTVCISVNKERGYNFDEKLVYCCDGCANPKNNYKDGKCYKVYLLTTVASTFDGKVFREDDIHILKVRSTQLSNNAMKWFLYKVKPKPYDSMVNISCSISKISNVEYGQIDFSDSTFHNMAKRDNPLYIYGIDEVLEKAGDLIKEYLEHELKSIDEKTVDKIWQ